MYYCMLTNMSSINDEKLFLASEITFQYPDHD